MIDKSTVKTLDVNAKEWFDRANGNSYHAVRITINYGLPDESILYCPVEYGYGDCYLSTAQARLGWGDTLISLTSQCRESGIILRRNIEKNCRLADVFRWGDPTTKRKRF